MKAIETKIPGVLIIETDVFGDHRGYFTETYNKPKYEALGITTEFVQDNMSFSAQKGTLRGLHWQNPPYAQAKLVSCTKGTVIDVAVDIRKGSPTFGQWVSVELSAENHKQFFIPRGFAHGFLTLTDDVEFRYKCDNVYNKPAEGCMRYDAPEVNVDWGSLLNGIEPVLSEKDKIGPTLDTSDVKDHCYGILAVIEKGRVGEVYNLGGHNEKANIEIVKIILEKLGKSEDLITHVADRHGHDQRYAIDPAKVMAELGWVPTTMFKDGIYHLSLKMAVLESFITAQKNLR